MADKHIDKFISFAEYAAMHGRTPDTVRQMALRGGFKTARKIGKYWVIDKTEPYPDRRVKSGEYIGWRDKIGGKDDGAENE